MDVTWRCKVCHGPSLTLGDLRNYENGNGKRQLIVASARVEGEEEISTGVVPAPCVVGGALDGPLEDGLDQPRRDGSPATECIWLAR